MIEAPSRAELVELLRGLDLFEGLPDARLEELAAQAEEVRLETGELLVREGELSTGLFVLLDGAIDWTRDVGGERVVVGHHEPVTYSGAMVALGDDPYPTDGVVVAPSLLVRIPREAFRRLVREEPALLPRVLRLFAPNLQRAEGILRQREKLAALGSLSAGLAHEINNPAAAARRDVEQLRSSLDELRARVTGLAGVPPEGLARLVTLAQDAAARARAAPALDPLDAGDREDELGAWLENRDVPEADAVASTLVDAGLDRRWLQEVESVVGPDRVTAVLPWLSASLGAAGLLDDLGEGIGRISELVGAIREYSYMDRAPVQELDVHDGLDTTLKILAHKVRRAQVEVERRYDRALPRITASGSALNQVWTNLIDNAVAAAPGGRVRVTTGRSGERLRVEVADDGAGIAPEIQSRIFEPFFTTKDVGEGTGLGLDTAYRVVVSGHGGELNVRSQPGDTRFEVLLPLGSR